MTDQFERYIKLVVTRTQQNGGSASKPGMMTFLPDINVWSFPKYPSRTLILPGTANLAQELHAFIEQNEAALAEADCWLGTWLHPQTGEYYLDVATGVEDLDQAYQMAVKIGREDGRQVVAMFNAKQNRTVYLQSSITDKTE